MGDGQLRAASWGRAYGDVHVGTVLCCRLDVSSRAGPLGGWTSLGLRRGHNGRRAISKTMKWVPIALCSLIALVFGGEGGGGGALMQLLWPKRSLSRGAIVGGGDSQGVRGGGGGADAARDARTPPSKLPRGSLPEVVLGLPAPPRPPLPNGHGHPAASHAEGRLRAGVRDKGNTDDE